MHVHSPISRDWRQHSFAPTFGLGDFTSKLHQYHDKSLGNKKIVNSQSHRIQELEKLEVHVLSKFTHWFVAELPGEI